MNLKKLITVQEGSEAFNKHLNEIRSFPDLDKAEEKKLLIIIRERKPGHKDALDQLIKANLKFVISVAKQYQGQGSSLADLISEGHLGMCEAVKSFDLSQDIKFFSYAVWHMRKHMYISLFNDTRTIRIPDNRALLVNKVKREMQDLEQSLQRPATVDDLVTWINKRRKRGDKEYGRDELNEALIHASFEVSIHDTLTVEDDTPIDRGYTIEDPSCRIDDTDHTASLLTELNRFFYNLPQKGYDVLVLSLGLNGESALKSSIIAERLDMKEKEVIRLKSTAIARMRKLKNIDILREYL